MINNKLRPYIFQLAYVVIGILILISVGLFSKNLSTQKALIPVFFLIGYICLAFFFKGKVYWRLGKIYLLAIGFVAGAVIQSAPILLSHFTSFSKLMFLPSFYQMAVISIFFTFFTVLWEELWFRNPILNLAESKKKQIKLSIFTGLLFATIHVMNPAINLLHDAPELFLAGVLLTVSYYASRSYWLPLGLHYGNNIFSSLIEKTNFNAAGNAGFNNELFYRWIVLIIAIVVIFLFWSGKREPVIEN